MNHSGRAQWTIRIPDVPLLLGAYVDVQGLVADPQVNAFGAVTTNGVGCVIGAR